MTWASDCSTARNVTVPYWIVRLGYPAVSLVFNRNACRHDRQYWSEWVICVGLILWSGNFLEWFRGTTKNVRWPDQFPCAQSKECNKNSSIFSVYSRRDGLNRICSKSDHHARQRENLGTIIISNRNVTCIYSILNKILDVLQAPFFPLFFWDKPFYILSFFLSLKSQINYKFIYFAVFFNKNSPQFEILTLGTIVSKSPGLLDPVEIGDSSSSKTLAYLHQITRH